ncbi:DUF2802 domain-containing protein [Thaumasiovibrio subtropicus]|uniref:DUF2802 domain-containing protein n=1 Tax=Thaumasiovibrio subtropicus TaxID=1891207 RepID=UPI000B35FE5D|nr:DUF2802 domain-containing protein [Thaumasiovibrio subtropicus]
MLALILQWVPLVVLIAVTVVTAILLRREKAARLAAEKRLSAVETVLKSARQQQESLAKQFNELRAGTIGMSQKLADMGQHLDMLEDRQGEIVMQQDPDNKLYSRASRMVELGADIEELMEECELPKAEAELLLSLQQKMTRRR